MTVTSSKRLAVIWMTFLDGRDHAVRDAEVVGCRSGIYKTVCGARLLPASSHAVPRPPCQRCGSFVLAWSRMPTTARRIGQPTRKHKHARPGWFSRLVCGTREQQG